MVVLLDFFRGVWEHRKYNNSCGGWEVATFPGVALDTCGCPARVRSIDPYTRLFAARGGEGGLAMPANVMARTIVRTAKGWP